MIGPEHSQKLDIRCKAVLASSKLIFDSLELPHQLLKRSILIHEMFLFISVLGI
jgi:hypothetical protein